MKVLLLILAVCIGCIAANTCVAGPSNKETQSSVLKKRWAIVALGKPGKSDLAQRNKHILEKIAPYSSSHNITIIIFSEKQFPEAAINSWKEMFRNVATVRLINTFRNGFNLPERFGYKYMCKFFALDMYEYLKNDYDYYMRCDTDCYLGKLNYDIMKWTETNNVGYGFAMRKLEAHKPTAQTLPVFAEEYISKCGIKATAVMDFPLSTCFNFYNNWHIGRVSFFTRPDVSHFLRTVNASGFIQTHRWGDSTIQAYAVRLFMNPEEIAQVPEFTYVHGSHNKMVSTFGDGSETNVPQRLPNWKYSK